MDGNGAVLYRVSSGGSTYWCVGPSDRLADCTSGLTVHGYLFYLSLGSNQGPTGGAPTAPEYSAGDGSVDHDNNDARGTISVSVGGGGGGH